MTRTTVFRSNPGLQPTNVNDEIGLDSHLDYTLAEHLEDLAGDGSVLVSTDGATHNFSDGTSQDLVEESCDVDVTTIHPDTIAMMQEITSLAS